MVPSVGLDTITCLVRLNGALLRHCGCVGAEKNTIFATLSVHIGITCSLEDSKLKLWVLGPFISLVYLNIEFSLMQGDYWQCVWLVC